jgi:CBS-domain-containing membrane protein
LRFSDAIRRYSGFEPYKVSHIERLAATAGAFTGILLILVVSSYFLDGISNYLIVASMGASAVLLFSVPHGRLSQPWPLVGGHLVSAVIGVTCAKLVPDLVIAEALAVGLAVGAMYYLHCIHPPGGATALTAVAGGEQVLELGYQYVLTPVLLNTLIILTTAVIFNYFFRWRRYPAALFHATSALAAKPDGTGPAQAEITSQHAGSEPGHDTITHEDFVYALSEIDSLIDVSETDLIRIYDLVTRRHESSRTFDRLVPGHYYSNGAYGNEWSVRQIIDWNQQDAGDAQLIYKIVAGADRRKTGICSEAEFKQWARHEVVRDEQNWRRVDAKVDITAEDS